jgi:hypothetical protein
MPIQATSLLNNSVTLLWCGTPAWCSQMHVSRVSLGNMLKTYCGWIIRCQMLDRFDRKFWPHPETLQVVREIKACPCESFDHKSVQRHPQATSWLYHHCGCTTIVVVPPLWLYHHCGCTTFLNRVISRDMLFIDIDLIFGAFVTDHSFSYSCAFKFSKM